MIRLSQLLLVLSAAGLWAASRMTWASVTTSDGLGQPKTSTLDGATWSTALLPIAVLLLTAALAALAVRGVLLKAISLLVAVCCLALGYLGLSLLVMPDVAPRGASLAGVQIADLVDSRRYPGGAVLTLIAAAGALAAAVLLMRAGASATAAATKYAPNGGAGNQVSERGMWEALDAGDDPTVTEGR